MSTTTRTPTEHEITDALADALEAVQTARWLLEAAGASGDELRAPIRAIEDEHTWYAANPGWSTAAY